MKQTAAAEQAYEMVAGLEVHVELKTRTKMFCGCPNAFDAPPNTNVCPVCLGLPGALPALNREAVVYAVRAGLALHCEIARDSAFARKHYFYPDLPKAYQISQHEQPLCTGGWLDIRTEAGEKRIRIARLHMEEDAGKLLHGGEDTRIDLNRCGVPLVEIVTEPDFRTAAEARAFLHGPRAVLLCIGVSDCRMNEGSMRCDVNLSVRPAGRSALGVRTEMKNINSIAFAGKAMDSEFRRQAALLRAGGAVRRQTRRFDPASGQTVLMREKESEDDYRFFPEPDLPPLRLERADIEAIRAGMPELPEEKKRRYVRTLGLTESDADILSAQPALGAAFDLARTRCREPARLANLLVQEVSRFADEEAQPFSPEDLAALSDLLSGETLHMGSARRVLEHMQKTGASPAEAVDALELSLLSDRAALDAVVRGIVRDNEALAQRYRSGKARAFQAIMGKIMQATKGRAHPAIAARLLEEVLREPDGP